MCSFLLHVVYSIGFISRFYCVVFFYSLCLGVCVCVCVCCSVAASLVRFDPPLLDFGDQ